MGLVKRIAKHDRTRAALCWLAAQYIRLVHATGRWEVVGGDIPARYWDAGQPFIMTFWHGRLMMMVCAWRRGLPMSMLTSHHSDGQLIARTVAHLGIGQVTGSTSRGGAAAMRGMLAKLRAGEYVGITPDGPRGPRMRASAGVVSVARLAGVPVIPVSYAASRRHVLGSWDRFLVPLPFSRGVFVWGRPIDVPRDLSEAGQEALRAEIEDRLNALTLAADSRMGHAAIEPAPWPTDGPSAAAP